MAQTHMALPQQVTSSFTMRQFLAASVNSSNGVFFGYRNALAVSERGAGADRSVDVAIGAALIGDGNSNVFYNSSAIENLSIAVNDSGADRIDTIVVELDLTQPAGSDTCVLKVVQGTPAGPPTAPTLTQTETLYQLPLADVAADDGFTSIVDADITDRRTYVRNQNNAATVIVQSGAETRTSTTLSDHGDFTFETGTNSKYRIFMHLLHDMDASRDIKFTFTVPSGAALDALAITDVSGSVDIDQFNEVGNAAFATDGTVKVIVVEGNLTTLGTGGTVTFQWAQDSGGSSGNNTLYPESYMIWEDVT